MGFDLEQALRLHPRDHRSASMSRIVSGPWATLGDARRRLSHWNTNSRAVLSQQKISAIEGNFTAVLDDR
jgi:hypothetical protein